MSKIRLRSRSQLRPVRTISVTVKVERFQSTADRRNGFWACARLNSNGSSARYSDKVDRRTYKTANACSMGSAPRRAVAAAMRKLARKLTARSSAFKGLR